jgi:hypothetical protein
LGSSFAGLAGRSVLRGLIISFLCIGLIAFEVFFPYAYYTSGSKRSSGGFVVGIHYIYETDSVEQIYMEMARIKSIGFRVVRVNLYCDMNNPSAYANNQTDTLFLAARQQNLPISVVILNHETLDNLRFYLGRWGGNLSYIQIMNEPELSQSWDLGTLFTDDEILTQFNRFYNVVTSFGLSAKLYTNFEPGFILRSNVPITLSGRLDFVGFDVYMQSFLVLSPDFVRLLHENTGKDVIITEFGMSTTDDLVQSDFLIQGLNLFHGMGLKGCWLAYWNGAESYYGIRGRLAEQKVGEWIAANS